MFRLNYWEASLKIWNLEGFSPGLAAVIILAQFLMLLMINLINGAIFAELLINSDDEEIRSMAEVFDRLPLVPKTPSPLSALRLCLFGFWAVMMTD
jgi:hypothetical protein